jgi:hypothetical protein
MHSKKNTLAKQTYCSKQKVVKTKTLYFRVPECLHNAICSEAVRAGLPITDVIRRIFEDRYQVCLLEERPVGGNVS